MPEEQRSRPRFQGSGPLLLALAGWACALPTLAADDDVHALVSRCHDSPGAPGYVLPLAWAGLTLGVGALCWGGRQVVVAYRRRSARARPVHLLLLVLLPAVAVGLPFQYALAQTAVHDTGRQRSSCFGHDRLTPALDPAGSLRAGPRV